jgi:hypothetical protein
MEESEKQVSVSRVPLNVGLCRHPTIEECVNAGIGPSFRNGDKDTGLPDTKAERERFEAYMCGHCWSFGAYDEEKNCYDTIGVRMLYGVWRDRGSLPTVWHNVY